MQNNTTNSVPQEYAAQGTKYSLEEDEMLLGLLRQYNNNVDKVSTSLPGRTKNQWRSIVTMQEVAQAVTKCWYAPPVPPAETHRQQYFDTMLRRAGQAHPPSKCQ